MASANVSAPRSSFSGGGSTSLIGFHSKTGDDDDLAASTSGKQHLDPLAEWKPPCIVNGLGSGAAAGVIGYLFGFLPSMLQNRQLASFGKWKADAATSAGAFALMSGLYTFTSCMCERIRQKDDGWNRAVAGFSSGVVVGWKGGAASAIQSGALIGALSYFLGDVSTSVTQPPPASASTLHGAGTSTSQPQAHNQEGSGRSHACCNVSLGMVLRQSNAQGDDECSRRAWAVRWSPGQTADSSSNSSVAWLGPIFNTAYFRRPALDVRLEQFS